MALPGGAIGVVSAGTLGITAGGTGTATQFTQGSAIFAGASGVYSQDNANFFWDATNHRLGLGTAVPDSLLTVVSGQSTLPTLSGIPGTIYEHTVGPAATKWSRVQDSIAEQNGLIYRRANGTVASPTGLLQDDVILNMTGRGWQGSNGYTQGGQGSADIEFRAGENWSNGVAGGYMQFRTTDNGTVTSNYRMRIAKGVCIASSSDASAFSDPGANNLSVTGFTLTPFVIGGTAVGSALTLRSTNGVGSSDAIVFQVGNAGGTEAARFNTSGQYLQGGTTAQTFAGSSRAFNIYGTSGATSGAAAGRWSADANGFSIFLYKSRNAAVGSHTIVQTNDTLGSFLFRGDDGTAEQGAASFLAAVDASPSAGIIPTRFVFSTANGSGVTTEALRIDSSQIAIFANSIRVNQAPSSIGTGTKTISNSADGSTNFGHYFTINLNGTVYYVPCGSVAPT
jgi:hypothetical protein